MDQKTLIKVLKHVVREEVRSVIKQELTEILQEGLKSTINEVAQTPAYLQPTTPAGPNKRKKTEFKKTAFADILNETEILREQSPYGSTMNENIMMTSADAQSFVSSRTAMRDAMMGNQAPAVIQDPETGRNMKVDGAVAKAMTRDYSELMNAMNKNRKG
jgi:hypothetical protein